MVCRKNPDPTSQFPLQFVKSFVSQNDQVSMDVDGKLLEAGTYILCIEALWNSCAKDPNSDYQAFCVKIQAKSTVTIKEAADYGIPFLEQALADRGSQPLPGISKTLYNTCKGAFKVQESSESELFYSYIAIFNNSNSVLTETMIFDKLQGFRIVNRPV